MAGTAKVRWTDIIDDLALIAFVLAILVCAQGCGAARAATTTIKKAPVPYKDIDPDCETAQDWGDEPYDAYRPCEIRSTGKI